MIKKLLYRLYRSEAGRWLMGAALGSVLLLTLYWCNTITFLNNDDANIMRTLAGYMSGDPYASHPFINCLLGLVVRGLYMAAPHVYWWPVAEVGAMLLSMIAITACIYKVCAYRVLPVIFPTVIAGLLLFGVYSYAVIWLSFTLTAAMLGTASVCLILTSGLDTGVRARTPLQRRTVGLGSLGLALLALAGCFVFRNSCGIAMLPFAALAAAYRFFSERRAGSGRAWQGVAVAAAGAALALGLIFVYNWGIARYTMPEYTAFEEARGRFMDYPHDSYDQNPELYESVGWDKELADMVEKAYYMDERVTPQALNAIVDGSGYYRLPVSEKLSSMWTALEALVRGNGQTQYTFVLALSALMVGALGWIRRKERWPEGTALVLCALGAALMSGYLAYQGRFPLRIYLMLMFPAATMLAILAVLLVDGKCALRGDRSRNYRRLNLALTAVVMALCIWGVAKTGGVIQNNESPQQIRASRSMKYFALNYPEDIFIRTTTAANDIDPYLTFPHAKPTNLIDWGGTSIYTGAWLLQLEENGVTDFTGELFRQDNVYLIVDLREDHLARFTAYMEKTWDAKGVTEFARITQDVAVFKVIF